MRDVGAKGIGPRQQSWPRVSPRECGDLQNRQRIMKNVENIILSISDDDKKLFIREALQETFRNVRHYQEIAYKASVLGTTGGVAYVLWLFNQKVPWSIWEKLGLEFVTMAFVLIILIVLRHCGQLLAYGYYIVSKVNEIYLCFQDNAYLPEQSLFPKAWSNLGTQGWLAPLILLLMVPPFILFLIASAIIIFHS